MRRAYKIALVSFVVALPLLMAPTGGIPSRPRFQAVTVTGNGASGQVIVSGNTSEKARFYAGDATGDNYISGYSSDGTTARWYVGNGGTADNHINLHNYTSGANINLTTVGTGDVFLNSLRAVSVISVFKAAPTTRTSTTTSAADPELTFTLPAGSWEVTGFLLFDAVTTTTQGARYQLNFAGTFDPALVVRCVDARTSLLAAATVGIQAMNSDTTIADVSTANLDIAEIRCRMRATVGGTVQVRWAQEASSANGTRLNNGSWLTATRVGN